MTSSNTDPNLVKSFREHKDKITQCIFSPNLKQIISGSMDGIVLATSLKANSRANKFQGHKGPVYDVAINPSSSLIASCSRDCTVRIWNNNASAHCSILKGHSAPVKSIEFNADGSQLVSASDDKLVKMWSVDQLKFMQTFTGHLNWVKAAQFSSDSRMIASGSDDRTVRIWDVEHGGAQIHQFTDHTGMVNDVKFHPDSTCLASCGTDKKIKIFDCRSHRLLQHYDAHDDSVNSISFNQAGTHLISSSTDNTIKIWDLRRGCILYTLFGHEGGTTSASFSPAGDYFLSGGADNVVQCWVSNMNPKRTEDLTEMSAKIETEQFVTQKERVDKLPATRGTKVGKNKETNNSIVQNIDASDILDDSVSQGKQEQLPSQKAIGGITYRQLKPEVKQTLDKVVYQLELVAKTLQMMEQRVIDSEDKLQTVMTFIKHNDLTFQPEVVNQVLSMNRYNEITGGVLSGDSPIKQFGTPMPGDPSIMYTIQKNQLADLQQKFAQTTGLVSEAQMMYENQQRAKLETGQFQGGTFAGSRQVMSNQESYTQNSMKQSSEKDSSQGPYSGGQEYQIDPENIKMQKEINQLSGASLNQIKSSGTSGFDEAGLQKAPEAQNMFLTRKFQE